MKNDKKATIFDISGKQIITGIVIVVVILTIFVGIITIIPNKHVETDNDWIGFFAALIGGLLSGGLTLAGVIITIRDGKEALLSELTYSNRPILSIYNNSELHKTLQYSFDFFSSESARGHDKTIDCIIENLGNGALLNLTFGFEGDPMGEINITSSAIKTIPINIDNGKTKYIRFRKADKDINVFDFKVNYTDIFGKSLSQRYRIDFKDDRVIEVND